MKSPESNHHFFISDSTETYNNCHLMLFYFNYIMSYLQINPIPTIIAPFAAVKKSTFFSSSLVSITKSNSALHLFGVRSYSLQLMTMIFNK
jgi:hypothetical protein